MIIDTTVFIDFFRNQAAAREYLFSLESIKTSRVVQMELVRGLKSKHDVIAFTKQLNALRVGIIEIDKEFSQKAGELFTTYHHAHGLGVMDAFIAATALVGHDPLVTHNTKHFRFIKNLRLVVPY